MKIMTFGLKITTFTNYVVDQIWGLKVTWEPYVRLIGEK